MEKSVHLVEIRGRVVKEKQAFWFALIIGWNSGVLFAGAAVKGWRGRGSWRLFRREEEGETWRRRLGCFSLWGPRSIPRLSVETSVANRCLPGICTFLLNAAVPPPFPKYLNKTLLLRYFQRSFKNCLFLFFSFLSISFQIIISIPGNYYEIPLLSVFLSGKICLRYYVCV